MNTERATFRCSYCESEITGDKFLLADESAVVLRLHPQCAAKLGRKLDSVALKEWSASYWQDKTKQIQKNRQKVKESFSNPTHSNSLLDTLHGG
jgi:hypothetical protein